jgi:parvulin-like peptidyl-prolyl isomerase
MKTKTILNVLFFILLILLISGCGKDKPSDSTSDQSSANSQDKTIPLKKKEPVDPKNALVIMQIDDQKLTNQNFKDFIKAEYAGIAEGTPNPRLLSRIFDTYKERKIVAYLATQANVPVDQLEINKYMAKIDSSDSDSPIDKTSVIESIKVQKYLFLKIYQNIEVTKPEITKYYNQHINDYRKKSEVLLHQILVKERETALRIRGELKNYPRRFAEIAKKESISVEAKSGGLMGYFEEGTLPKDMEKVVFSLNLNSISPVVESAYGFHIFKITKRKKSRLLYLKRVEKEIKNKLMSEKLRGAYLQFLAQSKQQLNININHSALYFAYNVPESEKAQSEGDTNNETINSPNSSNTRY